MKTIFATLMITVIFSSTINAAGVNKRQYNQRNRIEQGIKSGELTKREVKNLIKHDQHIKAKERLYKSDGILTKYERADLQKSLNRQSQAIYNQKHDSQSR